jgi:hypothetical protein
MSLNTVRYFLILLLVWGWTDDLWATATSAEPADVVITGENDQYPPSVRTGRPKGGSDDCSPSPLKTSPSTALFPLDASARPPEGQPPAFSGADPLYVFMSLQR